ncbi:MAG TPA: 3'(2'),5'-bisphosphate nucleotidase CysQ [Alphaproteobacteria bacterium]|nr:3'(2'),5'-bisphosphate nucleotidase CysQ [Alphaproteobacteria bacterium]
MTPLTPAQLTALIDPLAALARRAGDEVMRVYEAGFTVKAKADDTPVTEADEAAEAVILPRLAELLPGVPAISEEDAAKGNCPPLNGTRFWAVDPLDGTKEFIRRTGEFSVNIGLIDGGRPALGIIYAPVTRMLYAATGPGTAFRQADGRPREAIAARTAPADGLVVLASRSHDNYQALRDKLASLHVRERRKLGSSLKFCLIAEGEADLYLRYGPTSEWDTAAGQAILEAAGGNVTQLDGSAMIYGKAGEKFINPSFVAQGRR